MSPKYGIDYLICDSCKGACYPDDVGILASHPCSCKDTPSSAAAALVINPGQMLSHKRKGLTRVLAEDAKKASFNLSLKLWVGAGDLIYNVTHFIKDFGVDLVKELWWYAKHPPVVMVDILAGILALTGIGVWFACWYTDSTFVFGGKVSPRQQLIAWRERLVDNKVKLIKDYIESVKTRSDEVIK